MGTVFPRAHRTRRNSLKERSFSDRAFLFFPAYLYLNALETKESHRWKTLRVTRRLHAACLGMIGSNTRSMSLRERRLCCFSTRRTVPRVEPRKLAGSAS